MMAIHSKTNPYPGINIHLNSDLQSDLGDWVSYHSSHIIHLRDYIDLQLPDNYFAVSEMGLQIGGFDAGTGWETASRVRPDITITERTSRSEKQSSEPLHVSVPTGTLTLIDALQEPEELIGLVIYHVSDTDHQNTPIARIELLSPANKLGGTYFNEYSKKRRETLAGGLQLIEIDYLHASRPVIRNFPSYIHQQDNAYPYIVFINDPRPTFINGLTKYFAWHVDDPLPIFPIDLLDEDQVIIDLGQVYNHTYSSIRYYHSIIDYAEDPINLDTYTDADQGKILDLLNEIRKKQIDTN